MDHQQAAPATAAPATDASVATELPKWQAPRSLWIDFLVFFLSFGIYLPFWMYARAREMRALGQRQPRTPWRWFVMPLLGPLAMAIASPRFMEGYADLGRRHDLEGRDNLQGLIVFSLFITSVAMVVVGRFEVPFVVVIVVTALSALAITALSGRVNAAKRALPEGVVDWRTKKTGLGVLEWCLMPVFTMLWIVWIGSLVV
ncbi:MAG: hypothetical protein AAFX85_13770, partial [Pseudomonadota bacterium]